VPSIVLHGEADGVSPPGRRDALAPLISGLRHHETVPIAGHFLPREAPEAVVRAVRELGGF
jgi:pimeloyl-ACP methyl ester carboxylesterase